jgi:hypothetical protein
MILKKSEKEEGGQGSTIPFKVLPSPIVPPLGQAFLTHGPLRDIYANQKFNSVLYYRPQNKINIHKSIIISIRNG